ncbi:unnamed protein product (macronuclear) [Paramecium tetraurelia]|uniref:Uncharacterized protein n=1 Tax=Paramecium tetraurelia TaxID=5888 RepID=A0DCN3_PARTE|nr:uncharacterized protein GSPATT00015679001 [Paramecium tetraurelia]CAK80800.1 unnamed protein product [Paramecium tetraurelia]|eukprot:XP_001448197.1 hypothetical protein (macronuclear) [Paramecium tetraurelia strain d4-2]
MQNQREQLEIPRGQSFTFDSNRPFIYYYSVAKPLPDNIVDDLVVCCQIRTWLIKQLPKVWFLMASTTAHILIEKQQPKFVTQNFILDIFIYSWLSDGLTNLKKELTNRLSKLIVENEKLERLIDIFTQEIVSVQEEFSKFHKSEYLLNYNDSCVQPLIVFREKGKNENQSLIKRIDDLNVDDDSRDSTLSSSQISQTLTNKDIDRSKSDVREVTAALQNSKMRKFTKQMEKMTQNVFSELIKYNAQDQQWQIARQFVVIILETSIQSDHYLKTQEKVRFLQPALLFYKKALQVWILAKFSSQQFNQATRNSQENKMIFSQFLCKAKNFMGRFWNEKLVIPLHTVFQIAEQTYPEVQQEKNVIEQMKKFSILLKEKLVALWDQNLAQCTKQLIQQQ